MPVILLVQPKGGRSRTLPVSAFQFGMNGSAYSNFVGGVVGAAPRAGRPPA